MPIRIVLNESMSSAHAVHDADVHWTVAARGALCSKASSPKAMPFVAVITEPLPSTEMSHSPSSRM